jgi:hypothetical protein
MNGYVSRFRQSSNILGNFCVLPLVTEVTINYVLCVPNNQLRGVVKDLSWPAMGYWLSSLN